MSTATKNVIDWSALKRPFHPDELEWRVQSSGVKNGRPWARVLTYVTSRAIMDRLDEVVGPGNWRDEYGVGPGGGIMCGISISVDGEWITKYDGAENTDIEAIKGGFSGAFKRAAVKWGIGRYLYSLDATWADINPNGSHSDKAKGQDGKPMWFKWDPPQLPAWALPEGVQQQRKPNPKPEQVRQQNREAQTFQGFDPKEIHNRAGSLHKAGIIDVEDGSRIMQEVNDAETADDRERINFKIELLEAIKELGEKIEKVSFVGPIVEAEDMDALKRIQADINDSQSQMEIF